MTSLACMIKLNYNVDLSQTRSRVLARNIIVFPMVISWRVCATIIHIPAGAPTDAMDVVPTAAPAPQPQPSATQDREESPIRLQRVSFRVPRVLVGALMEAIGLNSDIYWK